MKLHTYAGWTSDVLDRPREALIKSQKPKSRFLDFAKSPIKWAISLRSE
jgi:hypothetical protein